MTQKRQCQEGEVSGKDEKGDSDVKGEDQGRRLATTLEQDGQGGKEEVRRGKDKVKTKELR